MLHKWGYWFTNLWNIVVWALDCDTLWTSWWPRSQRKGSVYTNPKRALPSFSLWYLDTEGCTSEPDQVRTSKVGLSPFKLFMQFVHFLLVLALDFFRNDELLAFLMLDDAAPTEQLIFVYRHKGKLSKQLSQFWIFTAWGGVEGITALLGGVAHNIIASLKIKSTNSSIETVSTSGDYLKNKLRMNRKPGRSGASCCIIVLLYNFRFYSSTPTLHAFGHYSI